MFDLKNKIFIPKEKCEVEETIEDGKILQTLVVYTKSGERIPLQTTIIKPDIKLAEIETEMDKLENSIIQAQQKITELQAEKVEIVEKKTIIEAIEPKVIDEKIEELPINLK